MRVIVFLANGFEEAEAICPIDVFRRAGLEVVIAGVGSDEIESAHGVRIKADTTADKADRSGWSAVFCPGGMPGAVNLAQDWNVNEILIHAANESVVAAICASPAVVLAPLGLLNGKNATCYPSCAGYAPSFHFLDSGVVKDGNIITGKSAGWAFDLGLLVVESLLGKDKAEEIRKAIYYKD